MLNRKHRNICEYAAVILTFLGSILVLVSSAMWSHHLQILCLPVLMLGIVSGKFLNQFQISHQVFGAILVVVFIGSLSASGWRFPLRPLTPATQWFSPIWKIPAEVKYIETLNLGRGNVKEFARLGPNDDDGLGGFISNDWQLVCRHYAQYGHETESMVDEIVNCVTTRPNYIFISPGFFSLERASGTYNELKSRIKMTLEDNYKCVDIVERAGSQFCTRINE